MPASQAGRRRFESGRPLSCHRPPCPRMRPQRPPRLMCCGCWRLLPRPLSPHHLQLCPRMPRHWGVQTLCKPATNWNRCPWRARHCLTRARGGWKVTSPRRRRDRAAGGESSARSMLASSAQPILAKSADRCLPVRRGSGNCASTSESQQKGDHLDHRRRRGCRRRPSRSAIDRPLPGHVPMSRPKLAARPVYRTASHATSRQRPAAAAALWSFGSWRTERRA
jgi:hypothetical protein